MLEAGLCCPDSPYQGCGPLGSSSGLLLPSLRTLRATPFLPCQLLITVMSSLQVRLTQALPATPRAAAPGVGCGLTGLTQWGGPWFPNTFSLGTFKHQPPGSVRSPGAVWVLSSDILFNVLKVLPQLGTLKRPRPSRGFPLPVCTHSCLCLERAPSEQI